MPRSRVVMVGAALGGCVLALTLGFLIAFVWVPLVRLGEIPFGSIPDRTADFATGLVIAWVALSAIVPLVTLVYSWGRPLRADPVLLASGGFAVPAITSFVPYQVANVVTYQLGDESPFIASMPAWIASVALVVSGFAALTLAVWRLVRFRRPAP